MIKSFTAIAILAASTAGALASDVGMQDLRSRIAVHLERAEAHLGQEASPAELPTSGEADGARPLSEPLMLADQVEPGSERALVAVSEADVWLGNPAGDVTVIEFFDYQCGYCRRVGPTVAALVAADPGVRVVLKEFPILGDASVAAARASLAANRQGKGAAFHHTLLGGRGATTRARIEDAARQAGVDLDRLMADAGNPAMDQHLVANVEAALALGINSTPTFVVGDRIIRGAVPLAELQAAIAEERARRAAAR